MFVYHLNFYETSKDILENIQQDLIHGFVAHK